MQGELISLLSNRLLRPRHLIISDPVTTRTLASESIIIYNSYIVLRKPCTCCVLRVTTLD